MCLVWPIGRSYWGMVETGPFFLSGIEQLILRGEGAGAVS